MKATIFLGLMVGFFGVGSAIAEPCVSATFDTPMPGAREVTSHFADVRSVQFPAFWQEGVISGFPYEIFSNGDGVLLEARTDAAWEILIQCGHRDETCQLTQTGTPTPQALRIAAVIGQCLSGKSIADTDFVPADPPAPNVPADPTAPNVAAEAASETTAEPPQEAAPQVAATETESSDVPCGVELVSERNRTATLQRMLVMAGREPGRIDGLLGKKTFSALEGFVDNPGWGMSMTDAINALNAHLCSGTE